MKSCAGYFPREKAETPQREHFLSTLFALIAEQQLQIWAQLEAPWGRVEPKPVISETPKPTRFPSFVRKQHFDAAKANKKVPFLSYFCKYRQDAMTARSL